MIASEFREKISSADAGDFFALKILTNVIFSVTMPETEK